MNKFITSVLIFIFFGVVTGEIVVRLLRLVNDVPQRTIDVNNIQKYLAGQHGYWNQGAHQWHINKLGWSGRLPKSYKNLISIIGDSYIENFMNPDECHQGVLLKQRLPGYNFIEAGRSGVSFIEAMDISKSVDTLSPKFHLLFMNNSDFTESIKSISAITDITQLDLERGVLIPGVMKYPVLKRAMYSSKFAYYIYTRFLIAKFAKPSGNIKLENSASKHYKEIQMLFQYVKNNYVIQNKVLVFHPGTERSIINSAKSIGFKTIELNSSKDKSWSFEGDPHWTCYGNRMVATQVSKELPHFLE
jgi:hypothetical protein